MTRKSTLLVAATILSISWASAAQAATDGNSSTTPAAATVATSAAQAGKKPNSSECKKDNGLFDRLGGFFGIAAVVDNFSDAILVNPVLNQNPALAAWNQNEAPTRLPGLKFGRTMWISAMVGGPIKYTGLPLEQAHDRFNMTPTEFAEVGKEIVKALQAAGVTQADIDLTVCIYQTSMDEVVDSTEPQAVSPPRQ
jgi:hemoglobin